MKRKSLQHRGEQEYFDIFLIVLSCIVDVGRLPGSNWSSNVFCVKMVRSMTILGLPVSIRDSFSSSGFPGKIIEPVEVIMVRIVNAGRSLI